MPSNIIFTVFPMKEYSMANMSQFRFRIAYSVYLSTAGKEYEEENNNTTFGTIFCQRDLFACFQGQVIVNMFVSCQHFRIRECYFTLVKRLANTSVTGTMNQLINQSGSFPMQGIANVKRHAQLCYISGIWEGDMRSKGMQSRVPVPPSGRVQ